MKKICLIPWMPCPKIDIPYPGLAYIFPLDTLIIAERADALHDSMGINKKKGFTIFNKDGEKVFIGVKEKRCLKFKIKIFNNYGNEVIVVKKPYKYCVNRVKVWAPSDHYVGSVVQAKPCGNTFLVKNRAHKTMLMIQGQGACTLIYDIWSKDVKVGEIMKQWPMEPRISTNNYGVSFPEQMDVWDKAVLLGASFLIGCLKYK